MFYKNKVILAILIAICSIYPASTSVAKPSSAPFRWEAVKYKGHHYVTVRSLANFYYFTQVKRGKTIVLENKEHRMILNVGSKQCRLNGILFILSRAVTYHKGHYLFSRTDLNNLIDPTIRPYRNRKARPFNTVVIDAGHGGRDSGSSGYFNNEKFYTLKVARMLRDRLKKIGYRVVMTRDSDVYITLANRVKIANRYPHAIFICIHFNSGQSKAHGIETYTVSPVGIPHIGRSHQARDDHSVPGNMADSASVALATGVHSRVLMYLNNSRYGNFGALDRGIKHARFNVLSGIKIPAILIEGGFLSNRSEAAKINTYQYQKALADAIVRGITVYQHAIRSRR